MIDSWSFPWYGNPDQDLVFMRDGLRLWRGQSPGYGDHPGLVQMLVVWLALASLRLSGDLGFHGAFNAQSPADSDWQLLFVASKLVNVFLMSLLLVGCSVLLARWLGRPAAGLWGVMCTASMAIVAEIYQLRNEFFSSFLALAAILIAVNGVAFWCARGHIVRVSGVRALLLAASASVGSYLLSFLSVLAKVQILPILLIFALAAFAGVAIFSSRQLLASVVLALGVLWMGQMLIAARFYGVVSSLSWQLMAVVLAVIAPPALLVGAYWGSSLALRLGRVFSLAVSLAGCMVVTSIFLDFSRKAEWLGLLASPASVRSYAENADACVDQGWLCYVVGGSKGISYLFERSVDSYALAPVLALLIFAGACACFALLVWPGAVTVNRGPMDALVAISGCLCIAVSLGMAVIAGQRWAVDHYLPYQQPFLFAGLLLMARRLAPFWRFWRAMVLIVAISVALVFWRYPEGSRATYVKESILIVPEKSRGDGSLCADQHAGSEWRSSSLWALCDGFAP